MAHVSYDAQCAQIASDLEDLYDRSVKFSMLTWEVKCELEKYICRSQYTRKMQQYIRGYYAAMFRPR